MNENRLPRWFHQGTASFARLKRLEFNQGKTGLTGWDFTLYGRIDHTGCGLECLVYIQI
jgi:hypothetical protein